MDRHIQPFNCVTRAGADPGQSISQWDVPSLYILDFGIVFLNPMHHSCNLWWSCLKVFLENCSQWLVVCFDSGASSIYIVFLKDVLGTYQTERQAPGICHEVS